MGEIAEILFFCLKIKDPAIDNVYPPCRRFPDPQNGAGKGIVPSKRGKGRLSDRKGRLSAAKIKRIKMKFLYRRFSL